jgi:hypothetical protein
MLTATVNFPTWRAPSPQIRARDTLNDGAANGSAGVNSAPDLGGQRCGDHEDRGDSTNYRKLAGNSIVEHVAGVDDFEVAEATYRAAVARWPAARITLRQGARVVMKIPRRRGFDFRLGLRLR